MSLNLRTAATVLVTCTTLAAGLAVAAPASAAPMHGASQVSLTSATDTYTIPSGSTVTVEGEPVTRLGAGLDGLRIYVDLNHADQSNLATGGAAALGGAICALPAVGWVACGAVAGALAIGLSYVNSHGLCASTKSLRVYLTGTDRAAKCV